jgi:hypothetical protein
METTDDLAAVAADWVTRYERAWRSPGTAALADLFTPDASYRMAPFLEPVRGLPAIAGLWEDQRTGPDEIFTMTSELVAASHDRAVVRVEVRYGAPKHEHYRDLWVLHLTGTRCHAFEEWPFWPAGPPLP